jgi:hypothetical protein
VAFDRLAAGAASPLLAVARQRAAEGQPIDVVVLVPPVPFLLGRWRPLKAELNGLNIRTHFLPRVPGNLLSLNSRRLCELFVRFIEDGRAVVVKVPGNPGAPDLCLRDPAAENLATVKKWYRQLAATDQPE